MPSPEIRLLLVDDEPSLLDVARHFLGEADSIEVDAVVSAQAALQKMGEREYDAVVCDYQMPEMNGIELLKILRAKGDDIPFILFTGRGREDVAIEALNLGADFYLQKGGDPRSQFAELVNMVSQSVQSRRSDHAMRESEQRYRTLAEAAPDYIYIVDRGGAVTYVNPAAAEALGKPPEEVIGNTVDSLVDHDAALAVMAKIEEVIATGRAEHHMESRLPTWSGVRWLDTSLIPLRDERGEVVSVLGMSRDVTDARMLYQNLAEKEEEYRRLVTSAKCLICSLAPDGETRFVNRYIRDLTGYEPEDLVGKNWWDVFYPGELRAQVDRLYDEFKGGDVVNYEMTLATKLGERKTISWSSFNIWGRDADDIVEINGAGVDITGRVRAEAVMRKALDRLKEFEALLNTSPTVLFVWRNEEGWPIERVSENVEQFGYSTSEVMASHAPYAEMIHPDDLGRVKAEMEEYIRQDVDQFRQEYRLLTASGEARWVEDHTYGRRDETGRFTHHQGIVLDITERRQTAEALQQVNRKLNLLGTLTRHDVLNEISILLSNVEFALESVKDFRTQEYLKSIKSSADTIRTIIEFSRTYQDLGTRRPEWIKVKEGFMRAVEDFDLRRISVEMDVNGVEVFADPLLDRVFRSLVENSIMHGKRVTEIRLTVKEGNDGIWLVYEDNGTGIEDEDRGRLFERGFGKHTGFGLYMAREILGITGLAISERGRYGKGVRFEISVPRECYRHRRYRRLI